ncbi:hypothetical protein NW762_008215 [Fusarium torreyae]|uniref:amidase n=1 Tax=Fusarium torreyae TaxID=1237075 RepID=A0A9W8RZ30_9HYPO|nr:hypothetical protein NW762_008215 [Fusarium torreyae]
MSLKITTPADKARQVRDESIAAVISDSDMLLPDPLPSNVQGIAQAILTQQEFEITECDPVTLVKKMSSKELRCETVIKAFLRRAALAHKTTNCITELLPSRAIDRARYLDSLPSPIGPLHGLPVSLKEVFGFEGRYINNGFVAWGDQLHHHVCSFNDALESCGAIIFARTTQPQSIMQVETTSNIYGRTVNPWNSSLTAGGSSGGEGALVAFHGSPMGVGGDIGGSIRVPAANNGVYGFKPSPFRVGTTGGTRPYNGGDGIPICLGPISPTLSGIEMFMESYLGTSPWIADRYLVPLPWRQVQLPKKLKIAVMWWDGIVKPHPPILRAMSTVVDALKLSDDFEVVDWHPKGHDECWRIATALYFEDGGKRLRDLLAEGEEDILPLTQWILEQPDVKYQTVEGIWDLKGKRDVYRQMYNKLWQDTGSDDGHAIDAILCPVGPGCAPPHEQSKYWCYTSQWNLLEYPAIAFPVTQVDQERDVPDTSYIPVNDQDKANHDLYTGPDRYRDAPVSLQLVTQRYEDEKCIEVLKRVESALGR